MEEDNITIMVVRRSGKIRTVKIAPKKLYIFIAGLLGLFIAFFTLLYGYISAFQQNSGLSNTVRAAIVTKKINSDQRLAAPNFQADAKSDSTHPEKTSISNDSSSPAKVSGLMAVSTPSKDDFISEKITIEGFQINFTDKREGLRFYFRLNNTEQGPPLSGYLAVIGTSDSGRQFRFRSYPELEIDKNGGIADFKRGEWFSIRRFKYVQGSLPFDNQINKYTKLTLYIYSIGGELIYRQTFGIVQSS